MFFRLTKTRLAQTICQPPENTLMLPMLIQA